MTARLAYAAARGAVRMAVRLARLAAHGIGRIRWGLVGVMGVDVALWVVIVVAVKWVRR